MGLSRKRLAVGGIVAALLPFLALCFGPPARPPVKPSDVRACVAKVATGPAVGSHALAAMPARERAALVTSARWPNGSTIRVRFLPGVSKALHDELLKAAAEWMTHANVKFVEVASAPSDVRVSADPGGGSWSYIGTGVRSVPETEATLNLGWADDYGRSLHELGHTLGLIHEHQNPQAKIPWNVPAVLAYYMATQGWSYQEIIEQVLKVDNEPLTNGGYDRVSIMEYPIPAALVTDPSFAVGWNTSLSTHDVQFIGQVYPFPAPVKPPVAPPTGPVPVPPAIFKFPVPAPGEYQIIVSPAKAA